MFKTADLYDMMGDQCQVCETEFKSYGGKQSFSGHIKTIKTYEDNSVLKHFISEKHEDKTVIVVDGAGSLKCALLGDNLAKIALENNIVGLIINGCVRDSTILSTLPIGILALSTTPKKSTKNNQGEVGVNLNFWGVTWKSGDYLYVDEDGVLIVNTPIKL